MTEANAISEATLTLILAGGQGKRLLPLTAERPKSVVPVGGVFRLIDFTLSNCFNSGLRRLFILTQYKYDSLHCYIRDSWSELWNRRHGDTGEYIICLPPVSGKQYRGTADALFQNIELIERERPKFVLVLSSDHIYQMDYTDLLSHHAASGAALTIAETQQPSGRSVNMGAYVFTTRALIGALEEESVESSEHGLETDIIPLMIQKETVSTYEFRSAPKGLPPYFRDIRTIDSYYESNMDLAQARTPFDPYGDTKWPVRTSVDVSVAAVPNALPIGRNVRNSIISPEVYIAEDAEVDSCVVLSGAVIGSGARVRHAIVEEGVEILSRTRIGFDRVKDAARYPISEKGVVIVAKSAW